MIRGNIKEAKRQDIENELRETNCPEHPYNQFLLNELYRRDGGDVGRRVASMLLRQNRRQHVASLVEIRQIRQAIESANDGSRTALRTTCFVMVACAVLTALVVNFVKPRESTNTPPPALPVTTQIPQPSLPRTNASLSGAPPVSQSSAPSTSTAKPQTQTTNH
jgi:hypothetical protein